MSRFSKVMCVILSVLIVLDAATGTAAFVAANRIDKHNHTQVNAPANTDNRVRFRDDIQVAEDSAPLQKKLEDVAVQDGVYTMSYKKELPAFFEELNQGDIFCVYPDADADASCFSSGFCGIVSEKDSNSIAFEIPEITDVFSEIYINTQDSSDTALLSTAFYPSDIVTEVQRTPVQTLAAATAPLQSAIEISESNGFRYQKPSGASLLNGYTKVCDNMRLKVNCDLGLDGGVGFGVSGSVQLEDMAVKMLLDYQYDEKTDTATINDYSLGFVAKQKINLGFSASGSVGLDDLSVNLIEDLSIINIDDVTEHEKGKMVLGTYIIGFEAPLPILQNTDNSVNYLSFGVAVQLAVSASGELSLEYNIEESGFAQIEVNGNGDNTCLIKGYEYPNPVMTTREPTVEEMESIPSVKSTMKGEAHFNMSFGADIGLCVLGMIPVKMSNNFLEYDITRSFSESFAGTKEADKTTEILTNNYLMDDNVNMVQTSSNSFLKMHLGAKLNCGFLKYDLGSMGGRMQLFKTVWYQSPPPVGFTHEQCGFGGVFVGNTYTDEELNEAYKTYMNDTEQNGILATVKDELFASMTNEFINMLDLNLGDLQLDELLGEDLIGGELDVYADYKFNFFTTGVLYIRDENNKVITALIIGEDVFNNAGIHPGLSSKRVEQTYAAPASYHEVYLEIGSLLKALMQLDNIENFNLAEMTYFSSDSNELMTMLLVDDEAKLIVVTSM